MKNVSEMQFYLDKKIDSQALVNFFSNVLAMKVMTLDHIDDEAPAFLQFTEYDDGNFPIGINISWNKYSHISDIEVASQLAQCYQVTVVTDLPEEHLLADDPFCWCLAEPNGSVSEISEKITDRDGLLLDENTKKQLEVSQKLQKAA